MHIKFKNGVVETYPYSPEQLRKDNPQTSFPLVISDALLNEYGVYKVEATPIPEVDHTKTVEEALPQLVNGVWKQVWNITNASQEEIQKRVEKESSKVKTLRNYKLNECDWVIVRSNEIDVPNLHDWKLYRQMLRDIPQQPGFPWNINWPVEPK